MKSANFLLILFMIFASFKANAQEKTKISFDLYAGGIQGVEATFSISKTKNTYKLETITQTKGFIGFLYPVTSTYITEGKIKGDIFIPQTFISSNISRGKETRKELLYNDEGKVVVKTNLRKGKKTVSEITDDDNFKESLDYQSAVAMSLARIEKGKSCAGSHIIFDGKRRYTMIFEDKGMGEVPKSRYSNFAGKAHECLISLEPIGDDYPTNSWFWYRSGTQGKQMPIKFWAKSFKEGNPAIPVKVEIDSLGFGAIIAHMSKME